MTRALPIDEVMEIAKEILTTYDEQKIENANISVVEATANGTVVVATRDIPAWNVAGTASKVLSIRSSKKHENYEWHIAAVALTQTAKRPLISKLSTFFPRKYTEEQALDLFCRGEFEKIRQWMYDIIRLNVVNMKDEWVLFDVSSFMSHSCVPNCMLVVVGTNAHMVAMTSIAAGEEVTTLYTDIPDLSVPDLRRKVIQATWGFDCSCSGCLAPDANKSFWKHLFEVCHACGKRGKLMQCSRCKLGQYCDADCRKKHYGTHKTYCVDALKTPNANFVLNTLKAVYAFSIHNKGWREGLAAGYYRSQLNSLESVSKRTEE
jgi:hypothetical protein